ncbi:hypothetical protein F5890DRAFT_1471674 [Lentinula detonsa]|uniref:Uncharacterized protein n=1 Tax=Lentinula detonsa TaxID=2804962 RepID=A0AA38Q666_9AGAR|nr:hypothetical protein F5890DRAFT_1471674 [Lentinula detonsa]
MLNIAFFAPTDFPELTVDWDERKLEIIGISKTPPFTLTVDEMIRTIQTSLALGRGWKITISPRYSDIASKINLIIPTDSDAYLSFIDNGKLHRSDVFVTYEHFFTPTQIGILQEENKLSNNLNRDTASVFPKPPRIQRKTTSTGSITGAMMADFTKSDLDQSILFAGLMAHARETQRKNLWRLKKNHRMTRSTRGSERYNTSETGSQSTMNGLNSRISRWRLGSTKATENIHRDADEMDTSSNIAGPSHTSAT